MGKAWFEEHPEINIEFEDLIIVEANDFIPIVFVDENQINKESEDKKWKYEGFQIIKSQKRNTFLSELIEKELNFQIIDIDNEFDEIIVRFSVIKGNKNSKDEDGFIEIKPCGIDLLTKSTIKIKYNQSIALKLSSNQIKNNAYLEFIASDDGEGFTDKEGKLNINCGKVMINGVINSLEVNNEMTQIITDASDPDWNNSYEWRSKYLIALRTDDTIRIQVRLFCNTTDEAIKMKWKKSIEQKWNNKASIEITNNNKKKTCKIVFRIKWINDKNNAHYTITESLVKNSESPRSFNRTFSMTDWYSEDLVDITHEFGHMLGYKEEYFTIDGVSYGKGRQKNKGIMNNPSEKPKQKHFLNIKKDVAKMLDINIENCKILI